ncbi:pancreatic lipase-related protein 2 [Ciona intestinalis]
MKRNRNHHKKVIGRRPRLSLPVLLKICLFYVYLSFTPVKSYKTKQSIAQGTKQTVCYEQLGCFSSLPPFSPTMPLPMSPHKIQTEYYLRTRQNPNVDQPIIPEASNLTNSLFDPTKPTKIIIHGYVLLVANFPEWVPQVTETILYQEDVNVIQINWVKGAHVEYDNAASNTRLVGAQVGYLIKMLMEVRNARAENFHLVGFSLGAHVAGFAGKTVQQAGKRHTVGRITGLDPANPGFNSDNSSVRLDRSDAKFVDIIHTDTHTMLNMASGMNRNLGHADFYPNGGAYQTGCSAWKDDSTWVSAVTDSTTCDHVRATQLFKESINATGSEHFMSAYRCDSYEKFKRGVCLRCSGNNGNGRNRCRRMGYWATPPHGKQNQVQYYLTTSGHAPFTVKHYQVQIHWRNDTATYSNVNIEGFKAKLYLTLHGERGSTTEIALNDGATFQVIAGKTTRFLVTQDTSQDIGEIQRVTFRWERPTCWTWFFCPTENIHLKRIKIFDAEEQRRYVYLPLGRDREGRIRSYEIKPDEQFELLRSSYIRSLFPGKYRSLNKEEAWVNRVRPPLVRVPKRPRPSSGQLDTDATNNRLPGPIATSSPEGDHETVV